MDSDPIEKTVETLIRAAGKQEEAHQAMQFSQAALNAANALRVLAETKNIPPS